MRTNPEDRERLSIRTSIAFRNRLKLACAQLGITQQDAVMAGLRLWAAKVGLVVYDLPDFMRSYRIAPQEKPEAEETAQEAL
jgi:hypothetical protein